MSKIFVSVSGKNLDECIMALKGADFAELRLDIAMLETGEITQLMKLCDVWIVSVREDFLKKPNHVELFTTALLQKPFYADIDISVIDFQQTYALLKLCKKFKTKLMLSYHNYEFTPSLEELSEKVNFMFAKKADYVKIACMANTENDCETVSALYNKFSNIIAFCLGDKGRKSRIKALKMGDGISYAAPNYGKATAQGQLTLTQMKQALKTDDLQVFNNC